jgi:cyclic pyranopterin phosphate synthase
MIGTVDPMDPDVWAPLMDAHGRKHNYLRVSLTDRCNFRCLYCMPAEGVEWKPREEILTLEEIVRLVGVFARMGIDKVRLTGGEPTVRKGFLGLVENVCAIEGIEKVAITTNATRLEEIASGLKRAGLTGINISLDSLQRARFAEITRRDAFDEVMAGIEAAIAAEIESIKLNVVVLPGTNDDELVDFVEFVRDRPIQVRFIEFMPFLGNNWKVERVIGYREMRERIEAKHEMVPMPGEPTDVAKEFRIEGFTGTVGFVTSVTESFCGGCNRIRLTADGKFKTCLFLPARSSLRDMMRNGEADEALAATIRADLQTKWAGHPPMTQWSQLDNRSMVEIGG